MEKWMKESLWTCGFYGQPRLSEKGVGGVQLEATRVGREMCREVREAFTLRIENVLSTKITTKRLNKDHDQASRRERAGPPLRAYLLLKKRPMYDKDFCPDGNPTDACNRVVMPTQVFGRPLWHKRI